MITLIFAPLFSGGKKTETLIKRTAVEHTVHCAVGKACPRTEQTTKLVYLRGSVVSQTAQIISGAQTILADTRAVLDRVTARGGSAPLATRDASRAVALLAAARIELASNVFVARAKASQARQLAEDAHIIALAQLGELRRADRAPSASHTS